MQTSLERPVQLLGLLALYEERNGLAVELTSKEESLGIRSLGRADDSFCRIAVYSGGRACAP